MSKQAFNDWHTKLPFPTGYEAVGVEAMYICWQAACEHQRDIDAKICDDVQNQRVDGAKGEYCAGREMAAEVIRNKIRANKGE